MYPRIAESSSTRRRHGQAKTTSPTRRGARVLRLLLIEDSESDAGRILHELEQASFRVIAERIKTPEELVTALERQRWDLAVADYTMPRLGGMAALTLLRERDKEMPFIFVSGTVGEDVAVTAMKTGAADYIMKDNLPRLVPSIEFELREAVLRRLRKRAEARLAHLAYHDALTGLPNRALFDDRLQQGILAAERESSPLSLMVLDLDGFKAVNDSLGHSAGDRLLQETARRVRAVLRDVDTVARLGGDEFAIVLPRTDSHGAALTARKMLQQLRRPFVVNGHMRAVSGSIGIASFPDHATSADELMERADIAMYVAKRRQGPRTRDRYCVDPGGAALPSSTKVRSFGENGVA